jgi:hypothetical protein
MDVLGRRPRPRVGIIGRFGEERTAIKAMFPTVWEANNRDELFRKVSPSELDLLIVGGGSSWPSDLPNPPYHFLFLSDGETNQPFVGPAPYSSLRRVLVHSEEYELTPTSPLLDSARRGWLDVVETFRFACGIGLDLPGLGPEELAGPPNRAIDSQRITREIAAAQAAAKTFYEHGALAWSMIPRVALALHFIRPDTGKGFAWIPDPANKVSWARAFVHEWAKTDPESFPGLADWHLRRQWQTPEELAITARLDDLRQQREDVLAGFSGQEVELRLELASAVSAASNGPRRVLTTQGHDLVIAVAEIFGDLGFVVEQVDHGLALGKPKREDLRISLPTENWTAICEVRGYQNGAAKTGDLQRIERFASMYRSEFGLDPDKRIYVCNGQIALPPNIRNRPFHAAPEDVETFAEVGGLIIDTRDLFWIHQNRFLLGVEAMRQKLTRTSGVLEVESDP